MELADLIDLMVRKKALRVQTDEFQVELSPFAFQSVEAGNPSPKPPLMEPADLCSCGHSLAVYHNPAGCLAGCSAHLCSQAVPGSLEPENGEGA